MADSFGPPRRESTGVDTSLPKDTLFEYFFVAGFKGFENESEKTHYGMEANETMEAESSSKKVHPLARTLPSSILFRYPERDREFFEFPTNVDEFCFPDQIRVREKPFAGLSLQIDGVDIGQAQHPTVWHSFTLTDEQGRRVFGTCLTVYEDISSDVVKVLEERMKEWKESDVVDKTFDEAADIKTHSRDEIKKVLKQWRELSVIKKQILAQEKKAWMESQDNLLAQQSFEALNRSSISNPPGSPGRSSPLRPRTEDTWSGAGSTPGTPGNTTPRGPGTPRRGGPPQFVPSRKLQNMHDDISALEEQLALYMDLLQQYDLSICNDAEMRDLVMPKTVGFIARMPLIEIGKDVLCQLYRISRKGCMLPIERFIVNLTMEVPSPPPGKYEVRVILDDIHMHIHRPPINRYYPMVTNFSYDPLFRCLDLDNVILVFNAVAQERKVILLSAQLSLLNHMALILQSIIYPMEWQHVFVPLLPHRLISFIHAPVPYLLGIQAHYLEKERDSIPDDVVLVDLDKDFIMLNQRPVDLPPKLYKKLRARLEAAGANICPFAQEEYRSQRHQQVPLGHRAKPVTANRSTRTADIVFPYGEDYFVCRSARSVVRGRMEYEYDEDAEGAPGLFHSGSQSSLKTAVNSVGQRYGINVGVSQSYPASDSEASPSPVPIQKEMGGSARSASVGTNDRRGSATSGSGGSMGGSAYGARSVPLQRESSRDSDDGQPRKISVTRRSPMWRTKKSSQSSNAGDNVGPLRETDEGKKVSSFSDDRASYNSAPEHIVDPSELPDLNTLKLEAPRSAQPAEPRRSRKGHRNAPQRMHSLEANSYEDLYVNWHQPSGVKGFGSTHEFSAQIIRNVPHCGYCLKMIYAWGKNGVYVCNRCHTCVHKGCVPYIYPFCETGVDNNAVRSAFYGVFVSLFMDYRDYLIFPENDDFRSRRPEDLELQMIFNRNGFVSSFAVGERPFVEAIVDTGTFAQFICERITGDESDFHVLFFDESIKKKQNRSRRVLSKHMTPFIDDKTYNLNTIYEAKEPSMEDGQTISDLMASSGRIYLYETFPTTFDTSLMHKYYPARPLMQERDYIRMRTHVMALARKVTLAEIARQRKKDGGSASKSTEDVFTTKEELEKQAKLQFVETVQELHDRLERVSIPEDELPYCSPETIERAIMHLVNAQQLIMEASDVADRFNINELSLLLRDVVARISDHEEILEKVRAGGSYA
eukprot:Clim_evm9s214 gene=Clim_evmTU9s214